MIWLDLLIETGGRALLGVELWAEIRRLKHVEGLSQREIHRRTGVHRDTIRNALASSTPPVYGPRPPRPSKLEPFVAVIEELLAEEPTLSGVRVREELEKLGYVGGKTILDDLLRELRPRFLPPPRSFQRTRYRPGELAQFDLCEPRSEIPVGWGQTRRGYVVTCELPYSRAFAGTLVFSKEFSDIAFGMSRCLARLGALPGKLVWDREGAIAPQGRPTEQFLAFCGQLALGWVILDAGDCQAKGALERSHRFLHGNFEAGRAVREPARLPGPARRLERSHQRARAPHHARGRRRAPRRRARADAAAARGDARQRPPVGDARAGPALPALRPQRLLAGPAPGRPPRRGARQPARGDRGRAGHRRARRAPRARVRRRPRASPIPPTRPRSSSCAASAAAAARSTSSCRPLARYDALIPA